MFHYLKYHRILFSPVALHLPDVHFRNFKLFQHLTNRSSLYRNSTRPQTSVKTHLETRLPKSREVINSIENTFKKI